MESTLSISTTASTSLFTISKALNRGLSQPNLTRCLATRLVARRLSRIGGDSYGLRRLPLFDGLSLRSSLCAAEIPRRRRLECVSSSAASFASGGGSGGFGGEGGGGDGGGGSGSEGGDAKSKLVAGGAEEASALTTDVIILDVGGMTCGGCAASVKRILESQPQVSSASVNLTTETAIVWPVAEAKVTPNWQKQIGEALAKHLTSCGFNSNPRGEDAIEGEVAP